MLLQTILLLILLLTSHANLFIPVKRGEYVRVWCQAENPRFGECIYRGSQACYLDFTYDSALPATITCADEGYDLIVTVTRENLWTGNIKDEPENILVDCLISAGIKTLISGRKDKNLPIMRWSSTVRGDTATGSIKQDEHNHQEFQKINTFMFTEQAWEAFECNGTMFSFGEYLDGRVYQTVAPNTTFLETSRPNNPDTTVSGISGVGGVVFLGLSTLYLILIGVAICGILVVACVVVCCCCRRNQTGTLDQASETPTHIDITPVYPIPSPGDPFIDQAPEFRYYAQADIRAYECVDTLPQGALLGATLSYNTDLQLTPLGHRKGLPDGDPGGYSHLTTQREAVSCPEGQYEEIPGIGVDTGYRYNVLRRDGSDDTAYQYNVLRRTRDN